MERISEINIASVIGMQVQCIYELKTRKIAFQFSFFFLYLFLCSSSYPLHIKELTGVVLDS